MRYRHVVITGQGGPDKLQLVEEEVPEPAPGEVRLRVLAAGVGRADILMRTGHYPLSLPPFPFSPGYDVVGEVEKIGENVDNVEIGQRVAALTKFGGYAEFICHPKEWLAPVDETLDPAEVVSLVLNGLTAYQMFTRFAKVQPGEQVLFHGAGSGVSTLLLQLGSMIQCQMFGTESQAKLPVVEDLGAVAIDYQREDFVARILELTEGGVHAAFDNIGGMHLWRSYKALRKGGRLIAYGEMALASSDNPPLPDRFAHRFFPRLLNLGFSGKSATWYENYPTNKINPDWYQNDLRTLFQMLKEGKLQPVISGRFPLEQARQANELLESSTVPGKIVLVMDK